MSIDDILSNTDQPIRQGLHVSASARSPRISQTITCHLLAAAEAALTCALTIWILYPSAQTPNAEPTLTFAFGAVIGVMTFLIALSTGAASYNGFASRIALLPGAFAAGLSGAFGVVMGGADWRYTLLCAVALFSGVYVAKIPAILLKIWLERRGHFTRLVAILSDDASHIEACSRRLRQRPDVQIAFTGSPSALSELDQLVQSGRLDEIVLADSYASAQQINLLADLSVTLVQTTPAHVPHQHATRVFWGKTQLVGPWNGSAMVLSRPPLQGWSAGIKRAIDLFGAVVALLVLGPLMLAVAIAIRLESPGPALFVQERVGYRNSRFRMYKFRSMRSDRSDATGAQLTLRDDPRVTKVGAFIRRTSIDELPQVLNVVIGNMSLVGPRPHPLAAKAGGVLYDELIANFYSRYRMKPGITGLAQVSGLRGNTETKQSLIDRFGKDVEYADEWTPLLDVAILFRTVGHLFHSTNAF